MAEARQEISAFFLRPFFDQTEERFGADKVRAMLQELHIEPREVEDPTAWVSLAQVEALCTAMARLHDDPALFEVCGRASFSSKYMGLLRPIIRAFGNPMFAYEQMTKGLGRFNKVGEIAVVSKQPGKLVLAYKTKPGMPEEKVPYVCLARQAQMSALPTLFDLPAATVLHPRCMVRGDGECVYEITWKEPPKRRLSKVSLAGGAVLGAGAGFALLSSLPAAAGAGVAVAGTGWLLGRYFELKREVGDRVQDLTDNHDALLRSAQATERRYAEVVEAKAGVERVVDERTKELRLTGARLEEALKEIQALDAAKGRFFANVSHDLRTPLQLILAPLSEMVAGREPPGGTGKALDTMQRSAERLHHLIDQLLDLAKLDAGAIRLRKEMVDPGELVDGVARVFASAASGAGIELTAERPPEPTAIPLDGNWIQSALSNLAGNALRVSKKGSKITLRAEVLPDAVLFQVADQGPGIPAEKIGKLFERFAQGENLDQSGSAGLGLAIVKEAARLHGGDVAVRSEVGAGTTFTLRIPRTADEVGAHEAQGGHRSAPLETPERIASLAVEEATAVPAQATSLDGPAADAPLVLVVEDHDDLRAFVADVVSTRCRVVTARNGKEGLALAVEKRPDLVISDVAMPEMDGLQLARALRERTETRSAAIMLLTARQTPGDVQAGYEAGADDYVPKPFHARELMARLDVQLRLRRMVEEAAHRERLASVGMIAAEISHQVRNPLNVIQNGLPVLKANLDKGAGAKAAKVAGLLEECVDRIQKLTEDLLRLSGTDRGSAAPFQPSEGLKSTLRIIQAKLPESVKLVSEIDEGVVLHGRPQALNHLFLNVLDNAARAVGASGTIALTAKVADGKYVVQVEDSGPGIPPEILGRVFDPFFTCRPAGEGTGLGLSIAKQVVELHGGTLSAGKSATLGGARLTATLPLLETARAAA